MILNKNKLNFNKRFVNEVQFKFDKRETFKIFSLIRNLGSRKKLFKKK